MRLAKFMARPPSAISVRSRVRSARFVLGAAGEIGSGFGKIEGMVTMQVGSHPGNLDFIDSLADCAFTWGLSGNGCWTEDVMKQAVVAIAALMTLCLAALGVFMK
jgi:hypothetical protein